MALSPNYNWSEPDNSSLVKDGAQAMRTLGNAIDTSLWNSGYGQAGKNKVINGDFGVWQRGTSFNANGVFNADRFLQIWDGSGATKTISQQSFSAGTAPVAGYESQYFLRWNQSVAGTGGNYNVLLQRIEDVRTLAGQTVTVSFWARAGANISMQGMPNLIQVFGTGGSSGVVSPITSGSIPALTTSWQRFSITYAVPSIASKTIGTGSSLTLEFYMPLNTTFAIDSWGVQVETGSKATPFQTASGGSIQNELAMCQRYYQIFANAALDFAYPVARVSLVDFFLTANLPVTMRSLPSLVAGGTLGRLVLYDTTFGVVAPSVTSLAVSAQTQCNNIITVSGVNATALGTYVYATYDNAGSAGFIHLSAEL